MEQLSRVGRQAENLLRRLHGLVRAYGMVRKQRAVVSLSEQLAFKKMVALRKDGLSCAIASANGSSREWLGSAGNLKW